MAKNRRLRRGIYLLPTVFTVGSLFCGFASIMQAGSGQFGWAALLILIAGLLDGLDGRIARLTNTTSEFGVEFDSLADIVSFGVAPAFLAHRWALVPLDKLGWLIAFVYVVCVAMRLARFNIQRQMVDKRYFAGLPSPAAAGAVACVVYASPGPVEPRWAAGLMALFVTTVATLTISRIRYRSFKELDLRNPRSYLYVFPMAVVLVAIATLPEVALPAFAAAYLLSGPVAYGWTLVDRRRRHARDDGEVADDVSARPLGGR